MSKFAYSGVAAGLIGGAMLLYGAVPATSATLPSPAVAAPGETATMIEKVDRKRERHVRRGDGRRRHYDRHRHGPRYSHRRPGFHHHYGGYWYASPWWVAPSIGFAITVPSVTSGYGSAHVQWCLHRYRSYDPATDTFLGYDGYRHRCNSPYL